MRDLYNYSVNWSHEDQEYVGTVEGFPYLSWLADTEQEALDGIKMVHQLVLEDMPDEY